MQEVRQRNHHEIDVIAFENVVRLRKRLTTVGFGKTLGALAVRIEDSDQARVLGLVDGTRVSVAGTTGAENSNSKFLHEP